MIEYREGHPCPYVVGLGGSTTLYLKDQSILPDPDSEDLSAFNGMFKKAKKVAASTTDEDPKNREKSKD